MNQQRQPVSERGDLGQGQPPRAGRLNFGALLRNLRFDAGLSQEALAERAELSVWSVGALERGVRRTPHHATVAKLIDALGLPPEDRTRLEVAAARPSRPRRRRTIDSNSKAVAKPLPPSSAAAIGSANVLVEVRHGAAAVLVVRIILDVQTVEASPDVSVYVEHARKHVSVRIRCADKTCGCTWLQLLRTLDNRSSGRAAW